MTDKLQNGDYCKTAEGLQQTEGVEALLQAATLALCACRGKFYPNKNFGSRLALIDKEPAALYAVAYAREALDGLDGVYVKNAVLENGVYKIQLWINDEEREVLIASHENL